MRELESSLQQFGEFILKARLTSDKVAPYVVRWVRRFLARPASNEPLADQVRRFSEELERSGAYEDWQVRQAELALRIYFVNFLSRPGWHRQPPSNVVDEQGRTSPLAAVEQLRLRLRAQNQAFSAILFLCREILGVKVEDVSATTRARWGTHLPVVLSMPETAALLNAMRGTARLMATLIYGGGLRVSECCELRIKDLDFDQGLVYVRSGKGNRDRSTVWISGRSRSTSDTPTSRRP